jgi:hypothetical protein
MLTATLLTLVIPAMLPQSWPIALLVPQASEERHSVTVIGPKNILASRSEFGRQSAAELMSYTGLADNWDGQGAVAVSDAAVDEALAMLEVTPIELGAPKAMVLATGDVALYWEQGEIYAEIGFNGSSTYYAHASHPDLNPIYLDDVPVHDATGKVVFPAAISDALGAGLFQDAA